MKSDEWYFAKNQESFRPVSKQRLVVMAHLSGISPTDFVWTHGLSQWIQAQEVPGLFEEVEHVTGISLPPVPAAYKTDMSAADPMHPEQEVVIVGGQSKPIRIAPSIPPLDQGKASSRNKLPLSRSVAGLDDIVPVAMKLA